MSVTDAFEELSSRVRSYEKIIQSYPKAIQLLPQVKAKLELIRSRAGAGTELFISKNLSDLRKTDIEKIGSLLGVTDRVQTALTLVSASDIEACQTVSDLMQVARIPDENYFDALRIFQGFRCIKQHIPLPSVLGSSQPNTWTSQQLNDWMTAFTWQGELAANAGKMSHIVVAIQESFMRVKMTSMMLLDLDCKEASKLLKLDSHHLFTVKSTFAKFVQTLSSAKATGSTATVQKSVPTKRTASDTFQILPDSDQQGRHSSSRGRQAGTQKQAARNNSFMSQAQSVRLDSRGGFMLPSTFNTSSTQLAYELPRFNHGLLIHTLDMICSSLSFVARAQSRCLCSSELFCAALFEHTSPYRASSKLPIRGTKSSALLLRTASTPNATGILRRCYRLSSDAAPVVRTRISGDRSLASLL